MSSKGTTGPTIQEMIRRLHAYWQDQGCAIVQGHDLEVGAGTFNPSTFLRSLGPEPYCAAYVEPSRRPADGRYGENPNRMQQHHQYQVILKPSPPNMQDLYLRSLEAVGLDLSQHDIRFIHDDWESPTLGAWGLGWEVWSDGMEVTQYTYFQSVGGLPTHPVTGELTYGIERLAMYLQEVDNVYHLRWSDTLTYGDLFHRNEVELSTYNFEGADTQMWFRHFEDYEREALRMVKQELPLAAYDFVMKASHAFNMLDARNYFSVTERVGYIARIRALACQVAEGYVASREALSFPLLQKQTTPKREEAQLELPKDLLDVDEKAQTTFLLEIGSEELPASFVPRGLASLERQLKQLLQKEGLSYDRIEMHGTPRRLTAMVYGLALGLPAVTEERRGPPVNRAYESEQPTKAAEGFFRSLGIDAPSLKEIQAGSVAGVATREIKGELYLFAEQRKEARSAAQILAEALPKIILSIDFQKTMRWGSEHIHYARPLRWITALLGKHVIPFRVGPIESGRTSHGHRQRCPGEFTIDQADSYVDLLRSHEVMVTVEERREEILAQLADIEAKLQAQAVEPEQVVRQVLHMVEWPTLAWASFDSSFLSLPNEVLISEMIEHQKYFPLCDAKGRLVHHFVITSDTQPTKRICHGNEKVLSARLSDGAFLYQHDLQQTLDQMNEKLKAITYQANLGTVWDKVKRLKQHVQCLHSSLSIGSQAQAQRAAELCKADLASAMVGEFPELQGVIGRYYALHQGEDEVVAQAIKEHYLPKGEGDALPSSDEGTVLSLAEKLDNILGCFAVGLKPTSSSDPYALRRQMLGIVRMLIQGKLHLPLRSIIEKCLNHFTVSLSITPKETIDEVMRFILSRVKTVFLEYDVRKDEIEASLSGPDLDIDVYDTFCRVKALSDFRRSSESFEKLFEVFKRARGQIDGQEGVSFDPNQLVESAEKNLAERVLDVQKKMEKALQEHNYDQAYRAIALLQEPLDVLFNEVRILAEDKELRSNRIALLKKVFALFNRLLDFNKIQE